MKPAGKFIQGLRPEMPADEAAKLAVRARLDPLPRLLRLAAKGGPSAVENVHQLRVATRRATAALDVFAAFFDEKPLRKMRKRLKRLRRAAGGARDADVAHQTLRDRRRGKSGGVSADERAALALLLERLDFERRAARRGVRRALDRHTPPKLRRAAERLIAAAAESPESGGPMLREVLAGAIGGALDGVRAAAREDLRSVEKVHGLRIAMKRLRYAVEFLGPKAEGRRPEGSEAVLDRLAALQERLGAINDAAQLLAMLERHRAEILPALRPGPESGDATAPADADHASVARGLHALVETARAQRDLAHAEFLGDWSHGEVAELADRIGSLVNAAHVSAATEPSPEPAPPPRAPGVNENGHAKPARVPDGKEHKAEEGAPGGRLAPAPAAPHAAAGTNGRIGAIDVGTNSIRLIIAEVENGAGEHGDDERSYRILDDEKEIARLGRGLERTGCMDQDAMLRAADVVAGMKGIAQGYGVSQLRVVGTAVVRAAANGEEFLTLLRERAGVELETISAEEEARLAFLSASGAFDLHEAPAAVVDIGGGSTEVVLAAAGVIDRIYTIPLGAVRLTERYGGAEAAAGERFDDLVRDVRREVRAHIGKAPFVPQTFIGTGGTFVALASMARHAELGPAGEGLFAGGIQGHEVRRWEVKHLLEYLRKLSPRERERVAGLSADRADIIVAGLVLVDAMMKQLGVNSVRAHEGGIRDGLLLQMIGRGHAPAGAAERRDPMRSVLRFARACGYEHRHCDHVARLATQIFDRLAAEPRTADPALFTPRNRLILHAAAIVHDVGYLINYTRHHKHSYHLIVNADMPGLTAREVEIIANLARYHRRAEPSKRHRNFARLAPEDRRTVAGLTAILRIADGLDRTHMQRAGAVRIVVEDDHARFMVEADEEPAVDIWGAQRKGELFERIFGLPLRFEWAGPPAPPEFPAGLGGVAEPAESRG